MELTEQVQRRCYADITERNQRGSGGWIDIASAGSPRLLEKEKEWTQIRTSGSEEPTTQAGRRRRAWPAGCRRRSRRRRCCSSEARAVVLLPWAGRARTVGLLPLLLQRPPPCAAPTRALHVTQGEERSAYVRNRRRGRGGAECRARTWSWRGTPPSWPWTACLWSPGRRDEAPRDKIPRTEWLVGSEWIRLGENGREGGARSRLWWGSSMVGGGGSRSEGGRGWLGDGDLGSRGAGEGGAAALGGRAWGRGSSSAG